MTDVLLSHKLLSVGCLGFVIVLSRPVGVVTVVVVTVVVVVSLPWFSSFGLLGLGVDWALKTNDLINLIISIRSATESVAAQSVCRLFFLSFFLYGGLTFRSLFSAFSPTASFLVWCGWLGVISLRNQLSVSRLVGEKRKWFCQVPMTAVDQSR